MCLEMKLKDASFFSKIKGIWVKVKKNSKIFFLIIFLAKKICEYRKVSYMAKVKVSLGIRHLKSVLRNKTP